MLYRGLSDFSWISVLSRTALLLPTDSYRTVNFLARVNFFALFFPWSGAVASTKDNYTDEHSPNFCRAPSSFVSISLNPDVTFLLFLLSNWLLFSFLSNFVWYCILHSWRSLDRLIQGWLDQIVDVLRLRVSSWFEWFLFLLPGIKLLSFASDKMTIVTRV